MTEKLLKVEKHIYFDSIRGCLIGGAAGDALGYTVEFMQDTAIFEKYGTNGITEYELDPVTGKALISDDTQMTLFTANGYLLAETSGRMNGFFIDPHSYIVLAYQDWLFTQRRTYDEKIKIGYKQLCWLCDVPELFHRRAPGNTCITALYDYIEDPSVLDHIKNPINDSKGCGGIMRIAPMALTDKIDLEELDMESAQVAAITHGHSLGYMPAALLCHIINRIVFSREESLSLKDIVIEAKETIERLFDGDKHLKELSALVEKAILLSENTLDDLVNIRSLGEGWVAEETLAIAIYCSLKYSNDFSKGIIAAANHSGDSDSTAAVTGNILGAMVGYNAIEEKWKSKLECFDVIFEIAEDICYGCKMSEDNQCSDDWVRKYIKMRWK